jgi:hypothetical protein
MKLRIKRVGFFLLKEIYQNIERSNKDIFLEAEDYCDPMEIVSIPSIITGSLRITWNTPFITWL